MKKTLSSLFVLMGLVLFDPSAHAFSLLNKGLGITEASPNICWAVDPALPAGVTYTLAQVQSSITDALAAWTAVSTAFMQFQACSFPLTAANSILYRVTAENPASNGGCATENDQGICSSSIVNLTPEVVEHIVTPMANTDYYKMVIIHETGHALGLDHSDRPALMAYIQGSFALTSDDWAGITYLYPKGGTRVEYAPIGCGTLSRIKSETLGRGRDGRSPPGPESLGVPFLFLLVVFRWFRGSVIQSKTLGHHS